MSTLTRTGTTSSRIVYALPAWARRVCAIRTVSCRLGPPQPLVIFGLSRRSELLVSCSRTIRASAWHGAHWHALPRILPHRPDKFTNSLCKVHDSDAKFWSRQNFASEKSHPDMTRSHSGFTHISRQFTTSLRTGTTRVMPVCAPEP